MIDANRYRAPTQAVAEAIDQSKRTGDSVRVGARGDVLSDVQIELYRECEGLDDDGTRLRFIGKDVEGVWWTVELRDLDLDEEEANDHLP